MIRELDVIDGSEESSRRLDERRNNETTGDSPAAVAENQTAATGGDETGMPSSFPKKEAQAPLARKPLFEEVIVLDSSSSDERKQPVPARDSHLESKEIIALDDSSSDSSKRKQPEFPDSQSPEKKNRAS